MIGNPEYIFVCFRSLGSRSVDHCFVKIFVAIVTVGLACSTPTRLVAFEKPESSSKPVGLYFPPDYMSDSYIALANRREMVVQTMQAFPGAGRCVTQMSIMTQLTSTTSCYMLSTYQPHIPCSEVAGAAWAQSSVWVLSGFENRTGVGPHYLAARDRPGLPLQNNGQDDTISPAEHFCELPYRAHDSYCRAHLARVDGIGDNSALCWIGYPASLVGWASEDELVYFNDALSLSALDPKTGLALRQAHEVCPDGERPIPDELDVSDMMLLSLQEITGIVATDVLETFGVFDFSQLFEMSEEDVSTLLENRVFWMVPHHTGFAVAILDRECAEDTSINLNENVCQWTTSPSSVEEILNLAPPEGCRLSGSLVRE